MKQCVRWGTALSCLLLALSLPLKLGAADTLTLTSATGSPGDLVEIHVDATNDDEIQGFSLAMLFDAPDVTPVGIAFSSTVTEAVIGGEPEFVGFVVSETEVIAGVILDLDPTTVVSIPSSPSTAETVAKIQFEIAADAIPGGQVRELALVPSLGTTADTIFSSFGITSFPTILGSGSVTIANEFRLFIPDTTIVAGASTELIVSVDHPIDLNAFQVVVAYDNSDLQLVVPPDMFDHLTGVSSGTIEVEFLNPIYSPSLPFPDLGSGAFALAAIFDAGGPFDGQVLPAGLNTSLFRMTMDVSSILSLGDCPLVEFRDGIAAVGIDNALVIQLGDSVAPVLDPPTICVGDPPEFRRGDVNTSGSVDIADAIAHLTFLFASGVSSSCHPAADANDDGNLDIADAISILDFLFSMGPAPAAPGPNDCGPDPTPSTPCGGYPPAC